MRTTVKRDGPFTQFLTIVGLLILIAFFSIAIAVALGWQPPRVFDRTGPMAGPTTAPALARPQAPPRAVELLPPTSAPVPVERVTQYEPAPPAAAESAPRVEVVTVQRAPEQTTIIRTVPQRPAGAPIVIDKGVKRMGAP